MVDALLARMIADGAEDDTALLALRFTGEATPRVVRPVDERVTSDHLG
jgi:hypothetical protein